MAEVLHQEQSPSSSSSSSFSSLAVAVNNSFSMVTDCEAEEMNVTQREKTAQELSLLAILVTLFRKTFISCSTDVAMEIGHPTNVRHVAHVTFDRFNGFLGLPLEFVPQVPTTPPSASLAKLRRNIGSNAPGL
ncbi:PAK-box/P21-Rho-binding domain rho GTPase activating protein [Trifolium pratense]|uniref:PAK-box/P21-Rho-binding domain rho GTPase activating protein n=1 Tax=Trifolium pratense TaxID=57577 RepID=A0A2K3K8C5_TRIPR|nr:PAK-box/P21-Rho-binding domain rho GTPase activating protein [Trifolium pratense]